jgi:hypothetical protein
MNSQQFSMLHIISQILLARESMQSLHSVNIDSKTCCFPRQVINNSPLDPLDEDQNISINFINSLEQQQRAESVYRIDGVGNEAKVLGDAPAK